MEPSILIGPAHWTYLVGVFAIVVCMGFRANVVVPSMLATFFVSLAWTGSPIGAIGSIFSASFVAAKELFNIFLMIALMTALLNALKALKSDVRMIQPFRKVMVNGHVAFVVLVAVTYVISLFFWPTPAVPLVAAVLLPAAIAAGLSPMAGAIAIAIAGQGMALSSDYMIGVAPGISAKAAGGAASAALVGDRALVLSLIVGAVSLAMAYWSIRKNIVAPNNKLLSNWIAQEGVVEGDTAPSGSFNKAEIAKGTSRDSASVAEQDLSFDSDPTRTKWSKFFAVLTPLAFLAVIFVMLAPKFFPGATDLKGGDAAKLIGGAAALLMILAASAGNSIRKMCEDSADHITDGFVFSFKAMGSVLPIAGFFFIGSGETSGAILGIAGDHAPAFLFELVKSAQHLIPNNGLFVAFGVLIVGMITGIDGSGFAGLPLTGALAGALGPASGMEVEALAAVGQMGAVWTGGGTLIAWSSLIAVAGFARVSVTQLARALLIPVVTGLVIATIFAGMLWG